MLPTQQWILRGIRDFRAVRNYFDDVGSMMCFCRAEPRTKRRESRPLIPFRLDFYRKNQTPSCESRDKKYLIYPNTNQWSGPRARAYQASSEIIESDI
jgi:hypothetical protein